MFKVQIRNVCMQTLGSDVLDKVLKKKLHKSLQTCDYLVLSYEFYPVTDVPLRNGVPLIKQ